MINTEASSRSARLDPIIPTQLVPEICCGVLRWWDSQWLQHCPSGHIQTHHLVKWSRTNKASYQEKNQLQPNIPFHCWAWEISNKNNGFHRQQGVIISPCFTDVHGLPASKGVAVPCHGGHFASRRFVLRLGKGHGFPTWNKQNQPWRPPENCSNRIIWNQLYLDLGQNKIHVPMKNLVLTVPSEDLKNGVWWGVFSSRTNVAATAARLQGDCFQGVATENSIHLHKDISQQTFPYIMYRHLLHKWMQTKALPRDA